MKKQIGNLIIGCLVAVIIWSCSNNSGGQSKPSSTSEDKKTEWTQTLNQYEDMVNRVNALQDRVKSGDMSAAQEVGEVSKQMIDVSSKCQQNQSSMSASEAKRLIDIMQKIKY